MTETKDTKDNEEKTIRYSIPVPPDLDATIIKYVPWGVKARLILNMIKLLAEHLKQNGPEIIGSLLNNEVKLEIIRKPKT